MKFIHRLGYYLGGFSIGLIFLAFFLSGKRTSCDYGPNARVIKNISIKKKLLSAETIVAMENLQMDSLQLEELIRSGEVNFSKSNTNSKPCKLYFIENEFFDNKLEISVQNCDSSVVINTINKYLDSIRY